MKGEAGKKGKFLKQAGSLPESEIQTKKKE
jgi:hypothetical protein